MFFRNSTMLSFFRCSSKSSSLLCLNVYFQGYRVYSDCSSDVIDTFGLRKVFFFFQKTLSANNKKSSLMRFRSWMWQIFSWTSFFRLFRVSALYGVASKDFPSIWLSSRTRVSRGNVNVFSCVCITLWYIQRNIHDLVRLYVCNTFSKKLLASSHSCYYSEWTSI